MSHLSLSVCPHDTSGWRTTKPEAAASPAMPSLEWTVREAGATLVELLVTNDGPAARVHVANRLDGPVWPPRRRGVPAAGWDDDGVTCTLTAGETRGLGYATPAPPAEPPVEIVRTGPVGPDEHGLQSTVEGPAGGDGPGVPDDLSNVAASPAGVVRSLGDPRPPRDAVPSVRDESTTEPAEPAPGVVPDGVEAWLSETAERVARAERLAESRGLAVAGEELVAVGGVAGARRLTGQVERDAAALREVAERAQTLATRAETVEVPIDAYRRLVR